MKLIKYVEDINDLEIMWSLKSTFCAFVCCIYRMASKLSNTINAISY